MDKTLLLDRLGATGEDRLLLAKVLDRAKQATDRNIPAATDFLSPQQQMLSLDLLRLAGISETDYVLSGGFDGAERKLILFLPDWLDAETAESEIPIRCLRAVFREEDKLNHRDFLGSLMGMGIVREKLGDILVSPDSADLIVLDTVAEFLLQSWNGAGRAKLRVSEIEPSHLHIPEVKCQEVRDTVSSLRLDAVASTGFKLARGKAADLVSSGRVQVNWRECTKPDKLLAAGDTVSARGFGKFVLAEVGGTTRKGRTSIIIKRYI
jgi:RNA-binding protein YlmH